MSVYNETYNSEIAKLESLIDAWRSAFDAIAQEVAIVDIDGRVVRCNSVLAKFLGKSYNEILGNKICDLLQEKVNIYDFIKNNTDDCTKEKSIEFKYKKDYYIIIVSPRMDKDNNLIGKVLIMTRVTERKKIEQKILRNQKQLRSLAIQLSKVEQNERQRLATVLHETFGQSLSLIKLKIDSLYREAEATEGCKTLDEIRDLIIEAIKDTRNLCFAISPPVLSELGIEAAIESMISLFSTKHGLTIKYNNRCNNLTLSKDMSSFVYHALHELFMNIVKHANAKEVIVNISINKSIIKIRVKDDGIGFNTNIVNTSSPDMNHFGLFSLQERLIALGGEFKISSKINIGTDILITIPNNS